MPLKNKVLPPDTVGFEDLLETIGVMPGDLGDFLGTSGYETWTGFEVVF